MLRLRTVTVTAHLRKFRRERLRKHASTFTYTDSYSRAASGEMVAVVTWAEKARATVKAEASWVEKDS